MKSILVIEPYEDVASVFALVLGMEGYQVTSVESLQEASELLSMCCFDLIITEAFDQKALFEFHPAFLDDLKMAAANTPIILCSTYPSVDYLRAQDYGLAAILPKPFDIDDLTRKVGRVFEKAGTNSLNG